MNLRNFKKIKFVLIDNDVEDWAQTRPDRDNPIYPVIAQNILRFSFLLKRKFDGTFHLSYSSYFSQFHKKAINHVKKDFVVTEIIEEN